MAEGDKPVEASQSEGRSHDASEHPNMIIKGEGTWNRAIDEATGYPSHKDNFDAAHATDPDPPVKVKLPND